MNLTNKYLPNYTFAETHSVLIKAPQIKCYQEMFELDLSQIWIVKVLFKLRRLPVKAQKFSDFTHKMNFTLLEENPFSEFILGFGVNNDGIQQINDNEQFITDDVSWFNKIVWSFEFIPITDEQTKVITITRIKNTTLKAKIQFSVYWFFIRPFSGLIRKKALKKLKRDIESE